MRKFKKTLIIVGIILGILIFMGGALATNKEEYRKSFSVEPGTVLKIYHKNGDIDISNWNRNEIEVETVRQSTTFFGKQPAIDISTGKNFVIRTLYSSFLSESARIQYRIKVPIGVLVTDVETSNGNINVENVSGNVNAKTSTGRIQITKVNGFVKAVTSSGNINITGVNGVYEARNESENIYVEVPAIRDNLTISSSSGNITVLFSPKISAQLEASTSSETVTYNDLPLTVSAISEKRITGKLGEGGGKIFIKSLSGSVILKKLSYSSPN